MTNTCPSCYSCGMPLEKAADHALGDVNQTFCNHCTDEKGNLKTYEDVLKGMANYIVLSQGVDKSAALKISGEVLAKQPAWKGRK